MNWGYVPIWLGTSGEQVGDKPFVAQKISHLIRQNVTPCLCVKNISVAYKKYRTW